jgi:alpha-mannosidase
MPSKLTGHVVSHTHWDRAWYRTFEQTRVQLLDLVDDLLDLMERDPGYKHFVLDGQLAMVLDYLELRHERTDQLRRLAGEGRLLLGPFFVLPDLYIPCGESLVRNLRAGHEAAAPLGPVMKHGYLPDPFGHPAQLPQVLRGFDIDGMLMTRGLGDEVEDLGADFLWEAPDGSQVLASHQVGGGYGNLQELGQVTLESRHLAQDEPGVELAAKTVEELAEEMSPYCPHGQLLLNNGCDHLPAQPELPRLIRGVNRRLHHLRLVHSTPVAYQRAVRRAMKQGRFSPGVHRGELRGGRYNNLLPGVLSARVDLKLAHDRCERLLLRWAEPWSALANGMSLGRDDRAALGRAWRQLILCQPHDDICGCSIDGAHDDDHCRMVWVAEIASMVRDRALDAIAWSVRRPELLAFNPHPWPVRAVIVRDRGPVLMDLPPLGWAPVQPSSLTSDEEAVRVKRTGGGVSLENDLVAVTVASDGRLKIHDRRTGRTIARQIELEDDGDAGDTYDYSPPKRQTVVRGLGRARKPHVVVSDPLRAVVRLEGSMKLPASLTPDRRARQTRRLNVPVIIQVALTAGSPVVELSLTVDNRVDDHRLRLSITSPVRAEEVVAGAPFEVVRRPVAIPRKPRWHQPPASTQPFSDFFAVEGTGHGGGIAVLAPGLREMGVQRLSNGCRLRLTLLRSVGWLSRDDLSTRKGEAGPCFTVQGARQMGAHSFRLALMPCQGRWAEDALPRRFQEFADPPRVFRPRRPDEPVPPLSDVAPPRPDSTEVDLPPSLGLVHLEPGTVALSALLPGPSGPDGSLEVRLVNLEPEKVTASLEVRLPVAGRIRQVRRARRLGLDGKPRRGKVDLRAIELGPCEILTLLLEPPR